MMKTSLYIFFSFMLLSLSSCHLGYRSTHNYLPLSDSIGLSESYTLYVRKLSYDMAMDEIKLHNEANIDSAAFKVIEMEYLLYQPETKQGILISYLPSYYYARNKTNKGGLYANITSDSTIYLDQVRRIMFLEAKDDQKFGLGNYYFTYQLDEANELEPERITLIEAIDLDNTYLTGTIHINESVNNPMQFDRRESFNIEQFIPKLGHALLQKNRIPTSVKKRLSTNPDAIRLYILDRKNKKGIVFKLPDGKNIIFGKSRTNWFSLKGKF